MSSRSCIFTLLFGFSSFAFAYSQTGPLADLHELSAPLAPPTIQFLDNDSRVLEGPPAGAPAGSISGRIFYSGGQEFSGIDGVKLTLRSVPGTALFVREQVSNETGNFTFDQLAPGEYALTVQPNTLPEKFRINSAGPLNLKVEPENETRCDIPVAARRVVKGVVFVDRNGDRLYTPGRDEVVHGALVSAEGILAVTDAAGAYSLEGLPAGRLAMLVQSSKKGTNATVHIVLDLGTGPVTNRVVNVPLQP